MTQLMAYEKKGKGLGENTGILSKIAKKNSFATTICILSSLALADNYEVFVYPEKHDAENAILARAIMLQMEIKMAARSSYDVTIMEGSLTTALIHMYKAVNLIKASSASAAAISPNDNNGSFVSKKIKGEFEDSLAFYKKFF